MAAGYFSDQMAALWVFPMTEASALSLPAVILLKHPVIGMLCMVLLTPLTVSCLFYATVFAPVCANRPRLAYLAMALALMIPRIFNIWWLGNAGFEICTYLLQLPVHLLACWAYQKTDTIWAPIAAHALTNLLSGLIVVWLGVSGWIVTG